MPVSVGVDTNTMTTPTLADSEHWRTAKSTFACGLRIAIECASNRRRMNTNRRRVNWSGLHYL